MSDYEIRDASLSEVIPLRVALLDPQRTGRCDPSAGDNHPAARHVGAFHDGRLVGIGSIHPQGMPGGYKTGAWRLTGLAVEHGYRGFGVGALLIERCLEQAIGLEAKAVWCLAPAGTYGFFERYRFRRSGEPIDDADWGPQYLVHVELGPLSRSWEL